MLNENVNEDSTENVAIDEVEPTDDGKAMATILDAVKENPSLINDPEIANVVSIAEGKKGGKITREANVYEGKENPVKNEQADKAAIAKPTEEQEVLKSIFDTEEQEGAPQEEIANIEAHIKEKYAIDNVEKFFSSVDKWRNASQDTTALKTTVEDIENAFTEMPKPLFDAFTAWSNGKEWQDELSGINGLDYGANFSDYNLDEIVQYYFPDEFESNDFEDYSDDPTIKRAIKIAEQQFSSEKEAFENQRADYANRAEQLSDVRNKSASSSVEKLKEAFPNFGKSELKKVKDTLVSGDLNGVFFEKDGAYTNDAAIRLALALYGRDEIGKSTSRVKKSQEILKSTVNKGASKPSVKSTQSQQTQVPEDVTGMFKDVFVKNYY